MGVEVDEFDDVEVGAKGAGEDDDDDEAEDNIGLPVKNVGVGLPCDLSIPTTEAGPA